VDIYSAPAPAGRAGQDEIQQGLESARAAAVRGEAVVIIGDLNAVLHSLNTPHSTPY
jgi:hypothetical protein